MKISLTRRAVYFLLAVVASWEFAAFYPDPFVGFAVGMSLGLISQLVPLVFEL